MQFEKEKRLVSEHVYCNMTSEVEYILKCGWEDSEAPFNWDDIDNIRIDNSEEIEILNDKLDEVMEEAEELEEKLNELEEDSEEAKRFDEELEELEDKSWEIQERIRELKEEEDEIYREPLEWWAVSLALADELYRKGYVVIREFFGASYWGRETSGQAIKLDGIIHEIAEDWYRD